MLQKCARLEFETFITERNNFHLNFVDNYIGDCYRKSKMYTQCQLENKSDFSEIVKKLTGRKDYDSQEYLVILYQAYLLMRKYTQSDWELFQ